MDNCVAASCSPSPAPSHHHMGPLLPPPTRPSSAEQIPPQSEVTSVLQAWTGSVCEPVGVMNKHFNPCSQHDPQEVWIRFPHTLARR